MAASEFTILCNRARNFAKSSNGRGLNSIVSRVDLPSTVSDGGPSDPFTKWKKHLITRNSSVLKHNLNSRATIPTKSKSAKQAISIRRRPNYFRGGRISNENN